jgi:DNA-directed RNA polymerase subunit RPC12/RpoP
MHIAYACPACSATVVHDRVEAARSLDCPHCGAQLPVPAGGIIWSAPGEGEPRPRLDRCLVCPSHELFVRKDFPQRLGVGIVVVGLAASCVTWGMRLLVPTFAILFATALIDVVLYLFMPECLTCYRCGARYRGDGVTDDHGGFDLETHEKHRQGLARARELAATRPFERVP